MSDALVSPPVFALTGAVSLALLAVAIRKVRRSQTSGEPHEENERIVPLMGVMGAFVFAAQMINFSIPGTGSSGHLVGGIMLAAVLGPWAAFITLSSVLVVQCLLFADGGLMALGANILNMAALSTLVAYPFVFRPLLRRGASARRILAASMIASIVGLELGALAVTIETEASGIASLPFGRFLLFMLPIHFFIGAGEGLATAAVLGVLRKYKPELLCEARPSGESRRGRALAAIVVAALIVAGSFSWVASSDPDGLEWSIGKVAGASEPAIDDGLHRSAGDLQQATALMPDYDTSLAGIVGCGAVLVVVAGGSYLLRTRQKQS